MLYHPYCKIIRYIRTLLYKNVKPNSSTYVLLICVLAYAMMVPLDLQKPSLLVHFVFQEIPICNIQDTVVLLCLIVTTLDCNYA